MACVFLIQFREIIKNHPGTSAARIAKYHLTRYQMNEALFRVAEAIKRIMTAVSVAHINDIHLLDGLERFGDCPKHFPRHFGKRVSALVQQVRHFIEHGRFQRG